jgi:PiT family inorganic phosphate transporter
MAWLIVIVVVALAFDYTNGFHDTANAIATSVSTRALSPRIAVIMAAIMNMLGAFAGENVAKTVGKGIIQTVDVTQQLVLAALVGAIAWNLITWKFGIPSSSSHALFGGMIGAAIASAGVSAVEWQGVVDKIIVPMVTSPVIGFVAAFVIMNVLLLMVFRHPPAGVNRVFRLLQPVSAAAVAFAHGSNDAQKTMGIITMSLVAAGYQSATNFTIPTWVIVASASAMALGTYSGGWRIIKTLGTKVIKIDPIHGFAAETAAAGVIYGTAHLGFPISTTQTITASIMGSGATDRLSAVRWGVAGNIVTAWVLTLPAAGLMAAAVYLLLNLVA